MARNMKGVWHNQAEGYFPDGFISQSSRDVGGGAVSCERDGRINTCRRCNFSDTDVWRVVFT